MSKELIKYYYDMGLFDEDDLDLFISSGDITLADKQEWTQR